MKRQARYYFSHARHVGAHPFRFSSRVFKGGQGANGDKTAANSAKLLAAMAAQAAPVQSGSATATGVPGAGDELSGCCYQQRIKRLSGLRLVWLVWRGPQQWQRDSRRPAAVFRAWIAMASRRELMHCGWRWRLARRRRFRMRLLSAEWGAPPLSQDWRRALRRGSQRVPRL
jgi:hypothetical protein